MAILVFAVLMFAYLAFADPPALRLIERACEGSIWPRSVPPLVLWGIFAVYAKSVARLTIDDAVFVLIYLMVPVLLLSLDGHLSRGTRVRLSPLVAAAVLSLWWPIEFEWLPAVAIPPRDGIPLVLLLGIISALYAFVVVYGLKGMGYTFALNRADWKWTGICFSLFVAFFGVPLGISLQFVESSPEVMPIWLWPVAVVGIFFFTALPEEILFRGIILNLLQHSWRAYPQAMLVLSAVIFGMAHANNSNPPFVTFTIPGYGLMQLPWVYVLLSTIAGWFYGLAYLKTGKVTASAVVHTLVNTWWALFLAG